MVGISNEEDFVSLSHRLSGSSMVSSFCHQYSSVVSGRHTLALYICIPCYRDAVMGYTRHTFRVRYHADGGQRELEGGHRGSYLGRATAVKLYFTS